MDLKTAVGIIAGIIDWITGLPAPGYTPIHPDNLINPEYGTSFPWTCIAWTEEDPGFIGGNSRWSEAHEARANIEVHIVITSTTSGQFAVDLMDWAKKIEDAIKAYSAADSTLFNVCVSKNEAAYDDGGRWGWLVSTLTLGGYKD